MAVGVGVVVAVGVAVGVAVQVGVDVGVGVAPPVTSRNAALIGPRRLEALEVVHAASAYKDNVADYRHAGSVNGCVDGTVGELNAPFIGMAVPPAQGGVSM